MKKLVLRHKNIYQENIEIQIKTFDHNKATEIIFTVPQMCIYSWLWLTIAFSFIAIIFKLQEWHVFLLATLIFIQILWLIHRIRKKVKSEKLLLVSGFGAVSTLTFLTGTYHVQFIPWVHIYDIVIAETITLQQVLFFLVILTRSNDSDGEKMHPVFLNSWPRLYTLKEIYRSVQQVL